MNTKSLTIGFVAIFSLLNITDINPATGAPIPGAKITWISKDKSLLEVNLGPFATFKWTNPSGSMIELTGGLFGASLKLSDEKVKGGGIEVFPGLLASALDPSYGTNGEPPISTTGQITSGNAQFTLDLKGFVGIDDITTTFTASLVSNGTDNPLNLSVFGQGDQLAFSPQGTLSYITKWSSSDVINLSNGDSLVIGDFYLDSVGDPSVFNYSITSTGDLWSLFTIGEDYSFVYDLLLPPTVSNLRFSLLGGTVTKELRSVPEPTSTLSLLAIGTLGAASTLKRKLKPSQSIEKETTKVG
jgi:hypothetical protein